MKTPGKVLYLFLFLFLFLAFALPVFGQTSYIVPGPDPFTLDALSAIYCIGLLKENSLILIKEPSGKSSILKVRTVWSIPAGSEESYPSGHKDRFNIIVNGDPLDWDNCFISYGGDLINLRLLFTYKNQYPPEGLEYRLSP